jgi:hypothetical protein
MRILSQSNEYKQLQKKIKWRYNAGGRLKIMGKQQISTGSKIITERLRGKNRIIKGGVKLKSRVETK